MSKPLTPLRAYLVDDEPLALRRLSRMLADRADVAVLGTTMDPLAAVEFLRSNAVDVLFLDIQMPDMDGFELLTRLERQPWVVFTTAFDEYALKAFDVNSIDYLLKPIERIQLDRALRKLAALREAPAGEDPASFVDLVRRLRAGDPTYLERIASPVGGRVRIIPSRRVSHFVAEDKLTFAVVDEQRCIVNETLSTLERKLDPARFLRIHRATIVNLEFVSELHGFFAGGVVVRLKDKIGSDLSVARDRTKELKRRLGL